MNTPGQPDGPDLATLYLAQEQGLIAVLAARPAELPEPGTSGSSPQEDILNYPLLSLDIPTHEYLRVICQDIFLDIKDTFVGYLSISYCLCIYVQLYSVIYPLKYPSIYLFLSRCIQLNMHSYSTAYP